LYYVHYQGIYAIARLFPALEESIVMTLLATAADRFGAAVTEALMRMLENGAVTEEKLDFILADPERFAEVIHDMDKTISWVSDPDHEVGPGSVSRYQRRVLGTP
jgi:hypothetical protein